MITIRLSLRILALTIFTLAFAAAAQAQATRTWVSGVGDDVNPCSRTAPCKTFAGAISKTFIHGEIDALDPGGFGTVTITKSITIDGGSAFASILASGTNGVNINIAVNANDPLRRVTLRRLSINGTGASGAVGTNTGIRGINVNTNGMNQLYVEDCYIQNFTTNAIKVDFATPATGARVSIRNTKISNIGTVAGNAGIELNTSANFLVAVIDNVSVEGTATGLNSRDRVFATVRDSVFQNCSSAGIAVVAPSNVNNLNVERTFLFSVTTGIAAGNAGTKVDISNTSIFNNVNPATSGGATLQSHGNNQINNNTNAGAAFTIIGQS
jgi:hypothetical protein